MNNNHLELGALAVLASVNNPIKLSMKRMLLPMDSKFKEKRNNNIKFGCYIYQDGL